MKNEINDLTVLKMGEKLIVIIPKKYHKSFPSGTNVKISK